MPSKAGKKCIDAFKKMAADYFETNKDAEAFLNDFESRANEKIKNRKIGKREAYNLIKKEMTEEQKIKAKIARRQMYINLRLRRQTMAFINSFGPKGSGKRLRGISAYMGGEEGIVKGMGDNVSANLTVSRPEVVHSFISQLQKLGVEEDFNNIKNEEAIAKAIFGEDVADENIKKIKKAHGYASEYGRKRQNELGANIGKATNRVARTSHFVDRMLSPTGSLIKDAKLRVSLYVKFKGNPLKVAAEMREMAFNRWRLVFEPATSEETFAKIEDRDKFFRSFFDSVTTGERKQHFVKEKGKKPRRTRTGFNIANKVSAARVWIPKDATSWIGYNRDYGFGTAQDAILQDFIRAGHNIGIMKKLGTHPKTFMESIIRKVAREERVSPDKNKYVLKARRILATALGDGTKSMDGLAGKLLSGMLNWIYMTRLGNVLLAHVPDVNNIASALRPYGMGWMKANEIALKSLVKGLPTGEAKQIALSMGVYADEMVKSRARRFSAVGLKDGLASKIIKINEKMTGIDRWDDPQRCAFAKVLGHVLSKNLHKSFAELSEYNRLDLRRYNIDSSIWEIIRRNKDVLQKDGHIRYVTPDVADFASKEDIAEIFFKNKGKTISEAKLLRARRDIKDRLRVYFSENTQYAKPFPDIVDRTTMFQGARRNTWAAQLWKQVTMFKSFYIAQYRRTWKRFIYGKGANNLYEAIFQGKADYSAMGHHILGTIPYEYLAISLKAIASGRSPPAVTDPSLWKHVMMGPMYVYGSFIYDDYSRRNSFLRSAAGPSISNFADLLTLSYKTFHGKATADQALSFALHNTPLYSNAFYKTALDYLLINHIHQKLDPTYKNRMLNYARKRGESYLWF